MKAEQQQPGAAASSSTGSSPDPSAVSSSTLRIKMVDSSNETTTIAVGSAQSPARAKEAALEQSRVTASASTCPVLHPVAPSEGIVNATFETAANTKIDSTAPQSQQPANEGMPKLSSSSCSPKKSRSSPSRALPTTKPPAVTLYDPKKSTHCTIHHPTLEELQSHSFTDYVRKYVLPAASVRYENLIKNNDNKSEQQQQAATAVTTATTTTADPFLKLSDPMKLREGIAKVVLPAGFESQPLIKDHTGRGLEWQVGTPLGDLEIVSPIQQNLLGVAGVYQYTFTDQRPITMAAFRDKADAYRKQQVGCAIDEDEKFFLKNENGERTEHYLTQERLDALERLFWKRLGPTMPPAWYGADQPGSLFDPDDSASGWSIAQLDSCLHVLHDIPGVTSSYLYAGMWGSVFAAHTEDMNLLSINYLHAGQPKFWYAVAEPDAPRFLTLAQFQFSQQAKTCPEFLRHKRCLLSPAVLKKAGIRYQTAVQYPGEAMITFPASYHFGFNLGFNVAEATNFGVPEWLPFGRQAKICLCRPHSVRIDMNRFIALLGRHQQDQKSLRRGNRLSWKEWARRREEKRQQQGEEKDDECKVEKEDDVAASSSTGKSGSSMSKSKKSQLSEQQRKKEFWIEVMKPISSTGASLKEGKGKDKTRGNKKRQKKGNEEEIWHLAKPIGRKGLEMDARVLCMAPGTTMWAMFRQQTSQKTNSTSEDDDSDEEEHCFSGQVVEISEGHVRVHIDGLPKTEDVWMPMNSSKLFLDGGKWNEKVHGIPVLHYWQEMDSKRRCL